MIRVGTDVFALAHRIVVLTRDELQYDPIFRMYCSYTTTDELMYMHIDDVFQSGTTIDWYMIANKCEQYADIRLDEGIVIFDNITDLFYGLAHLYEIQSTHGMTDKFIEDVNSLLTSCLKKINRCLDQDDILTTLSEFHL